jgi:hypothetical protein
MKDNEQSVITSIIEFSWKIVSILCCHDVSMFAIIGTNKATGQKLTFIFK